MFNPWHIIEGVIQCSYSNLPRMMVTTPRSAGDVQGLASKPLFNIRLLPLPSRASTTDSTPSASPARRDGLSASLPSCCTPLMVRGGGLDNWSYYIMGLQHHVGYTSMGLQHHGVTTAWGYNSRGVQQSCKGRWYRTWQAQQQYVP